MSVPDPRSVATLSREQVLARRARVHQLDRAEQSGTDAGLDAAILDLGVQETGPDGARWALRVRGFEPPEEELVWAWTLRGAPHAYRRAQVAQVATAVAPWSDADADAGKRIFDAARPLRAAGIGIIDALDHVAAEMADIVDGPTVKGEMSAELTRRLDEPYLRWCNPCRATHTYEQPFRLSALRVGLELTPGTSPPVLRRIPRWRGPATKVAPELDPVRALLHLLGPADPKQVAAYVDTTVKEVAARWPEDVLPVEVDGRRLDVLADDLRGYTDAVKVETVALLGPFDAYLQGRDRELVVPDQAARKDLWRTLGRPGGVVVDGEVVGSWRPRASRRRLRLEVTMWDGSAQPPGLQEQAERMADYRGVEFAGWA